MAERKSTGPGGAGRSFEFRALPARRMTFAPKLWLVWYYEHEQWKRAVAPMPEGAAAHYADADKRHAGAISMEVVDGYF